MNSILPRHGVVYKSWDCCVLNQSCAFSYSFSTPLARLWFQKYGVLFASSVPREGASVLLYIMAPRVSRTAAVGFLLAACTPSAVQGDVHARDAVPSGLVAAPYYPAPYGGWTPDWAQQLRQGPGPGRQDDAGREDQHHGRHWPVHGYVGRFACAAARSRS